MKVEANIEVTAGFVGSPTKVQEDTLRSIVDRTWTEAGARFEEECRMAGFDLGGRIRTTTEEVER